MLDCKLCFEIFILDFFPSLLILFLLLLLSFFSLGRISVLLENLKDFLGLLLFIKLILFLIEKYFLLLIYCLSLFTFLNEWCIFFLLIFSFSISFSFSSSLILFLLNWTEAFLFFIIVCSILFPLFKILSSSFWNFTFFSLFFFSFLTFLVFNSFKAFNIFILVILSLFLGFFIFKMFSFILSVIFIVNEEFNISLWIFSGSSIFNNSFVLDSWNKELNGLNLRDKSFLFILLFFILIP